MPLPLPPMIRPKMRFHPLDRGQFAMFWRAHDRMMDQITAWNDIQTGPNPITRAEFTCLQARRPERWGHLSYITPPPARPRTETG